MDPRSKFIVHFSPNSESTKILLLVGTKELKKNCGVAIETGGRQGGATERFPCRVIDSPGAGNASGCFMVANKPASGVADGRVKSAGFFSEFIWIFLFPLRSIFVFFF